MVHSVECPLRCQCSETESQFLRCPHIERQKLYDAFIKQLSQLKRQHHINQDLQYDLCSLLDTSRIQQSPPFTKDYVKILRNQRKIGNNSVFFRILHNWLDLDAKKLLKADEIIIQTQQSKHMHNKDVFIRNGISGCCSYIFSISCSSCILLYNAIWLRYVLCACELRSS